MYFFYIDESGNPNPAGAQRRADATVVAQDHVYVLVAVSLFEHRWRRFEAMLNAVKRQVLDDVHRSTGRRFELADAEIHSSVVRIPKAREHHKLWQHVPLAQLTDLTERFYAAFESCHAHLFAVVIDKRQLRSWMDTAQLQRKAYELLLERMQLFLAEFHSKHNGLVVADQVSREASRSLAMKHAYFLAGGTSSGCRLRNIVEMPFFVRSELSNGVQLADLCAYNVYRAFKLEQPSYPYFQRILPFFYRSQNTSGRKIDGLKLFPDDTALRELLDQVSSSGP